MKITNNKELQQLMRTLQHKLQSPLSYLFH